MPTTWNPADLVNTALSNGNLTASPTASNAGVRATVAISSGKYYFEYTISASSDNDATGIANASANLGLAPTTALSVAILNPATGPVWINGVNQGSIGTVSAGGTVGVAFDQGAKLIWFRVAPSGNWNGSGAANPATGVGGFSYSGLNGGAGTVYPYNGNVTAVVNTTANFGASAFVGVAPVGFAGFDVMAGGGAVSGLPAWDVPTPTGTLQGAAAFSWDGATWQPAGAAYGSVATPTGVLRGVAPFSWSGGAWQPSGLARPGVPTPTGTLDGVAVYTWSGSAWTPAGGAPDVPTPSGTLQGVAAFYFDGTNWQPTGQAAAEVATPSGVLQGMAMFSWGGTAWTPTVSGVAVDMNFVNTATLDARITFTRGSVATYFDPTGTMQTVSGNTPRFDYDPVTHVSRGLLIEEQRTNVLLNTATLGTQSLAVTAQSYVLSFYGTGTVTMSGAFAGSLVGTGAFPTRVSQVFTPAAGTLTLTVTGSVLNAQLEAGAFATSYIPTAGAAVTRAMDVATFPSGAWRNAATETYATEFMMPTTQNFASNPRIIGNAASSASSPMYQYTGAVVVTYDAANFAETTNALTIGAITKAASTWSTPTGSICLNAGPIASVSGMTNGFGSIATFKLLGDNTAGDQSSGYIRRFRYWPRVLSNTELQQVTT